MKYTSTRDASVRAGLSEAIERGLAADGGLYVPERIPQLRLREFDGVETLPDIAARLLAPFVEGDPLEAELPDMCRDALNFPVPLAQMAPGLEVLELFHGPTAAFKDVGARFLAACLQRINAGREGHLTILVATSGDTGGAVAAAFHNRPGIRVVVLYPAGLVSPRQEQQLTCWGGNVRALRVTGSFDDCQALVKRAFGDPALREDHRLCSANSINIGRLLPQMAYYAAASLWSWREHGVTPGFVVPTGNLGNGLACVYAREAGLPIGPILFATNANRPVPDFLASGRWEPRPSMQTLASAMDVGNPSNMERLRVLFGSDEAVRQAVSGFSVDDEEIRERIAAEYARNGSVWCPHTATGLTAYARHLSDPERAARTWIVVATAHAAKFDEIVEPLVGHEVQAPPALARLLALPSHAQTIDPELDALAACLAGDWP